MNPASATSTFTEFNVLEDLGAPHFVRLHDRVVKTLEAHLKSSAKSSGTETGMLTGTITRGTACVIDVSGFEALPAGTRGESGLQRRLAGAKAGAFLGYFKTVPETAESHAVDNSDRELVKRFYRTGPGLVLVLKRSGDLYTGVFALSHDGELHPGQTTVEFPLNLVELGAEDPAAAAPAPPATPPAAATAAKNSSAPAPAPPKLAAPAPAPPKPAAVPATTAKAAVNPAPAAGPARSTAPAKPAPTQEPAPAARTTPAPQAPPPQTPAASSNMGKTVGIAIATLALIGAGIWAVRNTAANTAEPQVLPVQVQSQPAAEPENSAVQPAASDPAPTAVAPATKAPGADSKATPGAKPAAAPPAAQPAPVRTGSTTPVVPMDTPRSSPTVASRVASLPENNTETSSQPDPASVPVRQEPAREVSQPVSSPVSSPAVQTPRPAPVQNTPAQPAIAPSASAPPPMTSANQAPVKPPTPLRQIAPVVSSAVKKNMTADVRIQVRAQVDAQGNVVSVTPITRGGAIEEALGQTAVAAVRQWKFQPAQRGSQVVAGETVLSFTFRR